MGIFSTSSLWFMLTTLKRWNLMLVKNQFSILPNIAFYKRRSETLQCAEDLKNTVAENHFICNVQNEQNNVKFDGFYVEKGRCWLQINLPLKNLPSINLIILPFVMLLLFTLEIEGNDVFV